MQHSQRNNLEIAVAFQRCLADKDVERALSLVAEGFSYVGPDGNVSDANGMRAAFAFVFPLMDGPMQFDIIGATSDGDRVALEMTGSASLKNGKTYSNRYHILFAFRDGAIARIHEYCDTKAGEVFFV